MKIKFMFAWYDLWIGAFYDSKSKSLYILPIPMFGIIICFETYCKWCKRPKKRIDMIDYYCCKSCDKKSPLIF